MPIPQANSDVRPGARAKRACDRPAAEPLDRPLPKQVRWADECVDVSPERERYASPPPPAGYASPLRNGGIAREAFPIPADPRDQAAAVSGLQRALWPCIPAAPRPAARRPAPQPAKAPSLPKRRSLTRRRSAQRRRSTQRRRSAQRRRSTQRHQLSKKGRSGLTAQRGAPAQLELDGCTYDVHVGPRGGRFIIRHGGRQYLTSLANIASA